ncbi:MAG: hypothetical protein AAF490_13090 [Chloroflexota bacterium]
MWQDQKFPEDQFERVHSRDADVTLYRRVGPKTQASIDRPAEFHCPQCDAPISFAPVGALTCDHCGFSGAIEGNHSEKVEKRPLSLKSLKTISHGWGTPRRTLNCQRCQASSSVTESTVAYRCPYCLSNQVVETHEENTVIRPEKIIPFQIEETAVQRHVTKWAKQRQYAPKGIEKVKIRHIHALYVPVWLFTLKLEADWKASGVESSGGESKVVRKEGVLKEHLKDVGVSASSYLSELPVSTAVSGFQSQLRPFQPEYVLGYATLLPDVELAKGWREARSKIRKYSGEKVSQDINRNGYHLDKIDVRYQDEAWSFALVPIYLATYHFQGKIYHLAINDYDGEVVGSQPLKESYAVVQVGYEFVPWLIFAASRLAFLFAKNDVLPFYLSPLLFLLFMMVSWRKFDQWSMHYPVPFWVFRVARVLLLATLIPIFPFIGLVMLAILRMPIEPEITFHVKSVVGGIVLLHLCVLQALEVSKSFENMGKFGRKI